MEPVATRNVAVSATALYFALELAERKWKVACSIGLGQAPRIKTVRGRDLEALGAEICAAKARFGLPEDAPVCSCYEAGRDGFWLHRALTSVGVSNVVVDSSSIEVDRRARRVKSDRLDVGKLLTMLMRYHGGEPRVWRVVRVPTPAQEDRRQLHRELETLKRDHTRVVNRVKSLLVTQGVATAGRGNLPQRPETIRMWNGESLPAELAARVACEVSRGRMIEEQIRELERKRKHLLRHASDPAIRVVRKLLQVRGIGIESAWAYAMEFFAWRCFRNVREVGALAGLVSAPYRSGDMNRDLGITKAGNRHVRALAIEIAWGWLVYQPDSELSKWYKRRFGSGSSVQRRKGIVALARKLLVALWKYVERDELPEGAVLKA